MSEENAGATPQAPGNIDLQNPDQVKEYFAALERHYPEIVEAIKVMGISYEQYLITLQSMSQQASYSTSSTRVYG